ncbi:MAG TPA: sigma-70 family RNA polymerase sigma factor, partial [Flavisolibacter sp.]|nr:sigma-70 family RNA polymerase sigma factor [Flavisolibacter sp.]
MTDENELIERTIQGDRIAFAKLFEQHHQRLGAFVFGITRSKETAEEIVLDIFLKIWMSREVLSEVKNFDAYLFVLAKNAAISALRKACREQAKAIQWKADATAQLQTTEGNEKELYLNLIDEAISQLSPQRKKIYLLSREEGLTYEAIGNQLGLSKLTVRAHIQQAVAFISNYVRSRAGNKLGLLL